MDESYLSHLEELRNRFSKESTLDTNQIDEKPNSNNNPDKKTMQMRIFEQERRQYHLDRSKRSVTYKIPEEAEVMDDETLKKIIESTSLNQFKKPWTKLNVNLKIDRINKYLKELKKEHSIGDKAFKSITMKMRGLINDKVLTKKKAVEYDEEEGIITNIPNLLFEEGKLEYVIEEPKKKVQKKDTGTEKKVKKVKEKEFVPKELNLLRNRNKKIRSEMMNKVEPEESNNIKN